MCILVSAHHLHSLDTITLVQPKRLEKMTRVYRHPPQVNACQNTFLNLKATILDPQALTGELYPNLVAKPSFDTPSTFCILLRILQVPALNVLEPCQTNKGLIQI
jgi:hypothetical protein